MTKTWSDNDPVETKEWLRCLASLIKHEGKERAQFILQTLLSEAEKHGIATRCGSISHALCNTHQQLTKQPDYPGDLELEAAIEAMIRWNAIAMVLKAKKAAGGVGGHLSSYASIATLYEVGMNHFFRGATKDASRRSCLFSRPFR